MPRTSVFTTLDLHPAADTSLAGRYSGFVERVVEAEALGFDACWLAEHHHCRLGTSPNPAVLLAAVAARTDTIRLGPAVSVLPLRSPTLIAEDYAMVDVLSGGRLNMGVGAGSQAFEFERLGVDIAHKRSLFDQHLAALLAHWHGAGRPGAMAVRPVQAPPPIYIATLHEDGAYRAGRAGHSVLTLASPPMKSTDELRARIDAHRRGLSDGGHTMAADFATIVFACVGETEHDALTRAARSLARFSELSSAGAPEHPRTVCEAMLERGIGLFGTTDQVRARMGQLRALGLDHLGIFADFGTPDPRDATRTLRSVAPTMR